MKKLTVFAMVLITFLFAGCHFNKKHNVNLKTGEINKTQGKFKLKITNQSSRHLTLADYNSISFPPMNFFTLNVYL